MSQVQTLTVGQGDDGARLDRWFKKRFPHIGHGKVQKLLRTGQIRVDGSRAKPDTRLEAGQEIRIPPLPEPGEDKGKDTISREDAAMVRRMVIFEDDDLIAFNKPYGLAVQGGTKTTQHLDRLLAAFGKDDMKPRLVHRLDRDTSGVIIAAKTLDSASRLAKAFQNKAAEKTYWSVVLGVPRPKTGEIKGFIKKSSAGKGGADREIMVPADHGDPDAQYARTLYTTAGEAGQKASFVVLRPITGRTHQLRVHMAGIGHAILGDGKYTCDRETPGGLEQKLHLHARRLVLPLGKRNLVLEAPLPDHIKRTFDKLGFDPDLIDESAIEDML